MHLKIGENTVNFSDVETEYMMESGNSAIIHSLTYLTPSERRLMILYAELGGIRPVAAICNCSTRVIWKEINRIKIKLQYICSRNL